MNSLASTNFSLSQTEGRWKTVTAAYRKVKDDRNKTGKERKEYEFESELDDVFEGSHTITPLKVFSSSTAADADMDDSEEPPTGNCEERKRKRKTQSGVGQMVDFMETYVEKVEKREEQRIAECKRMHSEKMDIFKGLIDVLKKNNE
ncbi:MAG: hypothetical protein ABW185_14925 [Sedimenticola sp.]